MTYVDGFLVPVPEKNLDQYLKIADLAAQVWIEHGALDYKECLLDDNNIAHLRPFTEAAGIKEGEVVPSAFIVYASKEARNAVNKKVMADPRMARFDSSDMPFDDSRMAFGGFQTIVERGK